MSFYGLGSFVYRYRWFVLGGWALILIVGAFFAPRLGSELKGGGFDGANTEAERVQQIMVDDFGVSPATLTVVFDGEGTQAASEEFRRAENETLEPLRELDEVRYIATYENTDDRRFISEDGEKSYAVVGFNVSIDETQDLVGEVRDRVRSDTLTTYVTGAPAVYLDIQDASNEDIRNAEKYAFPFAIVILIVAFGTLVAAGIPIIIGGASVVATLGALYFVASVYDMSIFVLTISTMLGLGLGIDYALFAVSRFREELEDHSIHESVAKTVATSGRSIFFSGLAVLIGLSGLLFFPFMFLRSIGVAGALVVGISVFAALTLLPAVLSVLGHRVNSLRIRRGNEAPGTYFFGRAAEIVMRRPVVVIILVGAILGALVYPVFHMKLAIVEATALPTRYESRAGDDILKEDFDYASLTPMDIVTTLPDDPLSPEGLTDIRDFSENIDATGEVADIESIYTVGRSVSQGYLDEIANAETEGRAEAERQTEAAVQNELDNLREQFGGNLPPGAEEQVREEAESRADRELAERLPTFPEGVNNEGELTPAEISAILAVPEVRGSEEVRQAIDSYVSGDTALIQASSKVNPYTEAAYATVSTVRTVEPPADVSFLVGGLSAGQSDFISTLYGKAPLAVGFVVAVTYLVLLATFRSVLLPLKAVFVNVLSLSASFGAMVFVFQDGNLSGLLNFTPLGFVDATLPVLMFCTIFGVSMDYEVFLLSRIREAYENGESNTASVAKGLTATAGIITSAALIIIVVTGAFAFTGIVITKAIGLGLAVAVFVDATIIRVLLVPATMRILGDWNWWPGGRKKTFRTGKYSEE
ncbi:MMPL family transporter [Rubrobacter indicoceani]|uniref:MMPL family transporter n=1 Tax=Rubrobacter indicoceani TaxID=2051957 RepID=UPI000E5B621A|nr:MMPL family transporter [Rubrobacter indicoceani]